MESQYSKFLLKIMAGRITSLLALALSAVVLTVSAANDCSTPSTLPKFNNTKLPNPFLFNDGTHVRTKEDFTCRQSQMAALIQGYEAGFLPPKPHIVEPSFTRNGSTATLNVTTGFVNKTISFAQTITFPEGTAPERGWPLLIVYSGLSIPVPDGARTIYSNVA